MELRQYLHALRKGWLIILVCLMLGAAAGALVNVRATPQYASTVTWFVSTSAGAGTSPLAADEFATRRITSYVGLLSADVTAQKVIDATGLDLSVAQVSRSISGAADLNTVLMTATVLDSSPERSLSMAGALADEFGEIVGEVDPIGPDNVDLRVVSGPALNSSAVTPRRTFNLLLGLLAGLLAGVVVALLREALDNTIRQINSLQELTGMPVLGAIPYDREAKRSPLIHGSNARSIRSEAFRQLRTNLQFFDIERPVQVLVITSSVPHEAKSTLATNLAASFAESGRKVLLVEADLRRPRVADYLGLERSVGLTSVLGGQVLIGDAIQPWGQFGLSVLASGPIPPNPSELLGSNAMASLIKTLRRSFDTIIIDTPPLLPVTDAAVAAKHSDGSLVVVRYGKTKRSQIVTAVQTLQSVDARILGTVLNMIAIRGAGGHKSYVGGYYESETTSPQVGKESPNESPKPDSELLNGRTQTLGGEWAPAETATDRPRRRTRLQPRRPTRRDQGPSN